MDRSINERFKTALKSQNIKSKDIANELGITPASVSDFLNGKMNLSLSHVSELIKLLPNINTEWLLRGEGDMNKNQYEISENTMIVSEPIVEYGTKKTNTKKIIEDIENEIITIKKKVELLKMNV